MREAFRNAYYVLEHDAPARLAWLRRTAAHFEQLEDVSRNHDQLRRALAELPADKLLLDLREGPPGRNDAPFENALHATRKDLQHRYQQVAVLVRTAAGRLQMQRLSREDGVTIPVFLDESEALRFLGKSPSRG
jgi:hypothetical protein